MLQRVPGRRIGLDLSPYILRKAQLRLRGEAELIRGGAMRLPFRDAAFDRVFCSEVLEHVLDPEGVLKEMRRVLAPSGWAVVSVPNEDLINRVKGLVFRLPLGRRLLGGTEDYQVARDMTDEWHLHDFGRSRLERAVEGTFRIDELVGVPGELLPLRYVARLLPF